MKTNRSAETSANQGKLRGQWRRWSAGALLACAVVTAVPPAWAQEPSASQATLNFVGADIESVIKAIGHYTHTTFIVDPRVKGTINLVSEKPVNKTQALEMLASALRLQGYAMVRTDGVTKVVPEADAKLQAAPIQIGGATRGDQIATRIYRLNYESAAGLVPVLRPLISPNNTINADPSNNSLVITDYADNLNRLGKIIAALDAPSSANLDVVPIQYGIASDVAALANRLLLESGTPGAQGGQGAATGATAVLADPRTNSVIIRAPSASRVSLAKSLIAKLDQPTAQPGNVHVVYLRNADAVKLAQTLRAVVASDASAIPGAQTQQQAQQPQMLQTGAQQNQQGQLGSGMLSTNNAQTPNALPAGGAAGFIQADPATNALIITASEPVYRNLRVVIDQLDARRAQVYIESLIVEVNANVAAEFGIQWLGLSGDSSSGYRIGGGTAFNGGSTASGSSNNILALAAGGGKVPPGNGLSIGLFRQINGRLGLGALARALETNGNANILSVPNLITLDNEEARIIVGQNVPFITGQYTTAASAGAAGVNPFQTIERRDIGLALRVRPQVSEGGTVKLAIYQETSSIRDTTNSAGIITNKRSIESNVLVDDGQIIVLGGLMEDQVQDNQEKVPGLGDIPVVGNLFKYQNRTRNKTNLLVFLRPTIIRTAEQSVSVMADRYDYIRGVQAAGQPKPAFALPDANAPAIPPLQNGYPTGAPLIDVPRNPNGSVIGTSLSVPTPAPPSAPAPLPSPQAPAPAVPVAPADPNPMNRGLQNQ
jgi:general secretion pathway protein D